MGSSKPGAGDSQAPPAAARADAGPARRRAAFGALALCLFALAFAARFHAVLAAGPSRFVAASSWGVRPDPGSGLSQLPEPDSLFHTDQRFVVWLTARNARALVHSPHRLFDAEPCFPAQGSLAFGEPGLSLGALGVLPLLVTGDPVAAFNLVFAAMTLIAAFAMYWVVRDWSGVPAAGVTAALLYAFSIIKVGDVVHIHVYDNAWTLLALGFGRRLFEDGRWRDAIGLALAVAMQLGGSFYPVMAASLLALPAAGWLLARHGLRGPRPAQLAFVVASTLCVAALVFRPYLALQGEGQLEHQSWQSFRSLDYLLPGQDGFWGWLTLLLLGVALSPLGRSGLRARLGDPRPALALGALLAIAFSTARLTGGDTLAGGDDAGLVPYLWLARILPGLGVVRAPGAILPAAHLVACLLAGLGAAALLHRVPGRHAAALAAALIALAAVDTLRPTWLGLTSRVRYGAIEMAPPAETVALYAALEREGGGGPLLELPLAPKNLVRNSRDVLLTAYHHQRTSACYNPSRSSPELRALARRLPGLEALEAVAALGFATIVLHHEHDDPYVRALRAAFESAASGRAGAPVRLARVAGSAQLTLYRIER